jgi:uncharacterized Zn-binding protein involved in type VI secretion
MSIEQQAKVTSPVAHVDIRGGVTGSLAGLLGGALLVILTDGWGLAVLVGALTGGGIGQSLGEMVIDPESLAVAGHITGGSPDTFIGDDKQKAARASFGSPRTLVDCHGGEYAAQGSETVFINRCRASRKRDGTSEGGIITGGEETVFTGGATRTLFELGVLPVDIDKKSYWVLKLSMRAAGLLVMPETNVGTFLYGLEATSLADDARRGPDVADQDLLGTANSLLGRYPAELMHAWDEMSTGSKIMESIGAGLRMIAPL